MITRQTARAYYRLTKPGIVYGNAITAIAGYFYGANGSPIIVTFFAMLIGISFVMASACVFNNILDRDIDKRMNRTRNRAVVSGEISVTNAILYGAALLVAGTLVLGVATNLLTLAIAVFGFIAYVGPYTYSKRTTVHSTLIGTISGSTPPVIGYAAATNQLDHIALLLFLILVMWQMAHFYAIAIFRRDEYAAAGLPILSVVKGVEATKQQIIWFIGGFIISCILLGLYGGASLLSTLTMILIGMYWVYLCFSTVMDDGVRWARKQFGWSLIVLLVFSSALALDSFWH